MQTWENSKNPNFGSFGPNLGPQNCFKDFTSKPHFRPDLDEKFLSKIYLRYHGQPLDIMVNYYHAQYQKN